MLRLTGLEHHPTTDTQPVEAQGCVFIRAVQPAEGSAHLPLGWAPLIHSFIPPPGAGLHGGLRVGHGQETGWSCPLSSLHVHQDTSVAAFRWWVQSIGSSLPPELVEVGGLWVVLLVGVSSPATHT